MISEEEFQVRIKIIDEDFQSQNVPIPSRLLRAISLYSRKYQISAIIAGGHFPKTDDKYDSTNIAGTIDNWYKNKYGDKLKKDLSLGQIALIIAGDTYRLKIHLIFGAMIFYAGDKYVPMDRIPDGTFPYINIFNFIENITKVIENELTRQDSEYILSIFNDSVELFNIIHRLKNTDTLVAAAKKDLDNAVNNLLDSNPSTGQSKWSSLQATEKIFKAILKHKGIKYKKDHDLYDLANKVYAIGFKRIDAKLLDTIQCTAGVRYGDEHYTLTDAIKSHHNSIRLCRDLLKFWESQLT